MEVASHAAYKFVGFVKSYNPEEKGDDIGGYLQDYVTAWLETGGGIEAVGGSFTVLLQTVIVILQIIHENPSEFDLTLPSKQGERQIITRRLAGIFDDRGIGGLCFHEDHFNWLVFNHPNAN